MGSIWCNATRDAPSSANLHATLTRLPIRRDERSISWPFILSLNHTIMVSWSYMVSHTRVCTLFSLPLLALFFCRPPSSLPSSCSSSPESEKFTRVIRPTVGNFLWLQGGSKSLGLEFIFCWVFHVWAQLWGLVELDDQSAGFLIRADSSHVGWRVLVFT